MALSVAGSTMVPRLVFRMRWQGRRVVGISRLVGGMQQYVSSGMAGRQIVDTLRNLHIAGDLGVVAGAAGGGDQGTGVLYVSVRRFLIYVESSLSAGTSWAVFKPNGASLWSRLRLDVGGFMQGLFMQGKLQGTTAEQAYFVKCDADNNPQSSVDAGVVNILVGCAVVYPSEFVVISVQQICQG